jgi:sarcosine oxidase, subunit gamma
MRSAWIRELPAASRFLFQGDAAARAAAEDAWQVSFSATACRAVIQGPRASLWLGPDEYLLWESPRPSDATGFTVLAAALQGHACSLVDVSQRQVAWELFGPSVLDILAGACALDLDLGSFPVGMCTRTVLGKADVLLWRRGSDVFHLEAWRSFAPYVVDLLTEIAAGYELS